MSLRFWRRSTPVVLQAEASECGLCCLAMVAGYHGLRCDIAGLRAELFTTPRGATVADLVAGASELGLATRAVRCELDELADVRLPAIAHWGFEHFVVINRVRGASIEVIDPAHGRRWVSRRQLSQKLTGVLVEVWPSPSFRASDQRGRLPLSALWRGSTGLGAALTSVLLLSCLIQVALLLAPLYLQWVVDDALVSGDSSLLAVLAIAFAALVVLRVASEAARSALVLHTGTLMAQQSSTRLFSHLLALPLNWFERRHLGDIVSRFGSLGPVRQFLTEGSVLALVDALMALATATAMFLYSPALALTSMVLVGLYTAFRFAVFPLVRQRTLESIADQAAQESQFMESVRAITPIKTFGLENERQARWHARFVDALNSQIALARLGIGVTLVRSLLFGLFAVGLVYLAAKQVFAGVMSVGMVYAFISYQNQFSERWAQLIDRVLQWRTLSVHLDRLADIALATPERSELSHNTSAPDSQIGAGASRAPLQHAGIVLKDVGFRYSAREPWIVRHVDLSIRSGEFVAIIGSSGGGKTTLLKMLMGLVAPSEGSVSVGGHSASDFAGLRPHIASIQQDDALLAGSLAENISLFSEQPDQARIHAAATAAALHADILRLPMGYRSRIGDMGHSLSGGQRQRVLLARALYRQPSLLFLDEGTSNLDPENTARILEVVGSLPITRVLVTHDASIAARADRVLKLEDGQLFDVRPAVEAGASETQQIARQGL
ncbi:MAG: peptidase domain-containing ABC transporter [Pseudomonadaceae bacterium]|nr:peptidase domain-containing ABC transporter [Pseudomonadaceae bacterium]